MQRRRVVSFCEDAQGTLAGEMQNHRQRDIALPRYMAQQCRVRYVPG